MKTKNVLLSRTLYTASYDFILGGIPALGTTGRNDQLQDAKIEMNWRQRPMNSIQNGRGDTPMLIYFQLLYSHSHQLVGTITPLTDYKTHNAFR
jgi:hypothetical protein